MKRFKVNNVSTQNSKISDFFTRFPPKIPKKETCENKRKFADTGGTFEGDLNGTTNLSSKCSYKVSPNSKKMKHDEHISYDNQEITIKTEPLSQICENNFKVITPEKNIKPSSSIRTPSSQRGKNKTPQSSKKGTPKKLFEKSPRRLEEFNVKILETFVKVSPSTSNIKIKMKETPTKNEIRESVRQYISPSTSTRNSPAQNLNETTPSKLVSTSTQTPKIKTRLNFNENIDPKEKVMDDDSFLEDDFNDLLNFYDDLTNLNLDQPKRCKILEVKDCNEKIVLKLKSKGDGGIGLCSVEEFWSSGKHFKVGDNISVTAGKNSNNEWVVNNEKGWLVYEPDLLVPCTSVVGSIFCKRKAVLSDRFRGVDPANRIMLVGTLAHSLLQQALKKKLTKQKQIEELLKRLLESKDTVKKLYEANLTIIEIESELQAFVPKLVSFINDYCCDSSHQTDANNWQGKICDISDIEENLWCPELGIKGKIDVTAKTESGILPLELKTGRATVSIEHRGQVVLYIMMMNKFGYQVSSGLLLYLREGILKEIKATPQEKRDIMILRNELAYFLSRSVDTSCVSKLKPIELPEPLFNHRACPKCSYNTLCTSYLKFEDHDIAKNKVIQDVQSKVTAHLNQSHLDYFIKWSNLLSLESEHNKGIKTIQQIYTLAPSEREALGRSLVNMKVTFVGDEENGLFRHIFEKENPCQNNLTAYDLTENNYIVVSTDSRPAVATGFITDISPSKITVVLDRNLHMKYRDKLFHLDTYDSRITFTFNITSLALLLENTTRAAELRSIIIDKEPPTFASKLPSVVAKKGAAILRRLNHIQQRAVLKALSANQFFLIKGMPGTGKSATIVALIQLLVELDKSVLITSHTHSAIDNICIRLQKLGVDFIRLGSESKIDPKLKPNSEATLTKDCSTPQEMEEVYNKYKVIAVTCLGSSHPLLSKRTIDVCIVDESTQVLQTSVIKPLYATKSFILIGDPNQLAPLVRHREALDIGMSESLFERLENSEGTVALNLNYRMNKTITDLANALTYGGQLQTASEVANRSLIIPQIKLVKITYQEHSWLLKSLDMSLESAVQFIDTGPTWNLNHHVEQTLKSVKSGDSYDLQNCLNVYEVAIVVMLVKALIEGGVSNSDVGVIATYRAQVNQISDSLERYQVDVSTVDQFQGRDKGVIIYSCTKSTSPTQISNNLKFELLEDKRRLTVAVTRAKRKLLIVGDASTLQKYKTFSVILKHLEKHIIKFDSQWSILNNI